MFPKENIKIIIIYGNIALIVTQQLRPPRRGKSNNMWRIMPDDQTIFAIKTTGIETNATNYV